MIVFGRTLSLFAILGSIVLATTLGFWPELGRPETTTVRWIDILGALVALSMPVTWVSAVLHWGMRFPNDHPAKARWGLASILGLVIGAVAYWFWGVRHVESSKGAP